MVCKIAFVQCFSIFLLLKGHTHGFEYSNQAQWYDEFVQCSLAKQSPIELNSIDAINADNLPNLYLHNYDLVYPNPISIENNGHTANIILPKLVNEKTVCGPKKSWQMYDKLLPQVYGGPLHSDRFVAESVHFHWGSQDNHGSEHVINGERHSLEMHVVHRNSKYKTLEEARKWNDGLCVLAVLFQATELSADFQGLACVIDMLDAIKDYNSTSEIQSVLTLSSLMGLLNREMYFTYEGSLTTPPCSQSVTWIVFSNVISISHSQMMKFHKLLDDHGHILENNYRSLQAKGNRKILFRKKACTSSDPVVSKA